MNSRPDPHLSPVDPETCRDLRVWAASGRGWTSLLVDDSEATARIAAETDLETLRALLAHARRTGNLRWVIALCDRIAQLSPTPQNLAERVRSRLHAHDLEQARSFMKALPAEMRPRDRAMLDFDLAEAEADASSAKAARLRVAAESGTKEAALTLREAVIRLGSGDLDGARLTLATARDQGASAPVLALLEVRLTFLAEGPAAALVALDDCSDVVATGSPEWRAQRLRLLNARGRWAEALDLALSWIPAELSVEALPTADLLAQALDAALMSDRLSEFYDRLRAIEQRYQDVPALVETLCICAIEDDDQPAIDHLMDQMRHMDRWRWLGLALRLACHTGATAEVDRLRSLIRSEGCLWPGPDIMTALYSYYFEVTPDRLSVLLDQMTPVFDRSLEDPGLQALRLRLDIALGRDEAARRRLEMLPAGLRRCAVLQPFEMYFAAREGKHAAAREGWRHWIADTAPIATDARASYPQTVALRFDPKPGAILCFVCIFNGIEYVDWFLDHYRRLGVDHFFFCDNASTDGTAERLMEHSDVSLFHASDSFAAAGCGIFWINHLMRRYGIGHWCVHVDMDEALVFPGIERGLDLRDLTSYLDSHGYGCTSGSMIDMVPPGFPYNLAEGQGPSTFDDSSCFDAKLIQMPCELPPYSFVKGGVRSRMTGRSLLMTKSPLLRMSADTAYLVNNHHHTHLPVSDVTTAVLHYKFIGYFRNRLEEAIERREHFQGARFYRQLDRSLDEPTAKMEEGGLVTYVDPAQLVSLGLLRSSAEWDATLPRPLAGA